MVIARKTRRAAGSGTCGTINGYHFEALTFPDYELDASRISKLRIPKITGGKTMANFDRGWDIQPRTKYAGKIVDFLAANLADLVYKP